MTRNYSGSFSLLNTVLHFAYVYFHLVVCYTRLEFFPCYFSFLFMGFPIVFIYNHSFVSQNFFRSSLLFIDNHSFLPPPFSHPPLLISSYQPFSPLKIQQSSSFTPSFYYHQFNYHPALRHPRPSSYFSLHLPFAILVRYPALTIILLQPSSCFIVHPHFLSAIFPQSCRMNRSSDSPNRTIIQNVIILLTDIEYLHSSLVAVNNDKEKRSSPIEPQ